MDGAAPCHAHDIAHYIISACAQADSPVTALRLQAILYVLQLVYCQKTGSLIFQEHFSAGTYGPIIDSVYNELRVWGPLPVDRVFDNALTTCPGRVRAFIDSGIEHLSRLSMNTLFDITRCSGGPWDLTWKNGAGYKKPIDNHLLLAEAHRHRERNAQP